MDTAAEIEILKTKLRARVPDARGIGCFACAWILGDLEKHGTLTKNYPDTSFDGKPTFPMEGKMEHLVLEGFLGRKSS